MKQDSVNIDSVVVPSVSSPSETFDGVSANKYRIKPKVTAV